jgi:alkanesulfonate monooxygenase SsuD/methylene tetrahydromethanopterin reductase-like flavin-dependent oxidoreductase (luciferase family)
LFTEPVVDFEGRWDRIPLAGIMPRPANRIPIWMGGGADRVLDRAGRLADGWFPLLRDASQLAEPLAKVHAAAEASGRDPRAMGVAPTLRLTGDYRLDVERALEWQAAGATHLYVSTMGAKWHMAAEHIDAIEDFKSAWDHETHG